ncbi:MAG TPA: dehydrogenase E1 component subunit alpha/beta [Saprospiraceae bacterium]|nr:dehydrogenase E1 component subunit alpha/beta [Saprospiraceae bacterium]
MTSGVHPALTFDSSTYTGDQLIHLYRQLLRPRLIEEKMLLLLRQGKITKWFSGIGQEAIAVGCAEALHPDEYIFTLHRNLGVFTSRQVPLLALFSQWQGKATGFTKGRDRSFHFGIPEYHIIGMISHLGPQLSLADGVAMAHRFKGERKVSLAFTGEGGTSEGEFHEALNLAAVWDLPVIFIIENNGYGLSTPTSEQFRCNRLADRAAGYGMEGITIDGNNILEVYQTIARYAEALRENPRPVLIECMTFRMRGHEEASGTKYVPPHLMEIWAAKDPVDNYEQYLVEHGVLSETDTTAIRREIKEEIQQAWDLTELEPEVTVDEAVEIQDVYRPHDHLPQHPFPETTSDELRFVDAIKDGLLEAMKKHPNLVLMGQDIAGYGGVFKITEGFLDRFGAERVRNTPLCESAVIGAALGASLHGLKTMVEMQFADFVSCGFNQIVNNLAKLHYRWEGLADVVIRMPTGAGTGAGPFHSQSNEAWFFHTPGLKIVYPSTPYDAKGLLLASFEDPNPVLYFEHKALYRKIKGNVPQGYYTVPVGEASVVRTGTQATIVTYGAGVHWATEVVASTQWDIEIIDLRTLLPLDFETIEKSIRKTHRALILHEDTLTGGIGGEIAARIGEALFAELDAPVMRVASLDTPVPFAIALENVFLARQRLERTLEQLINY